MNFQVFKLDLEKLKEPEIKLLTSTGSLKKQEFQKNIYFCFSDYAKAFDCVDGSRLWKIFQEMGIPDHFTCLLRNLYACQEATVWNRHGTMDWLKMGKGVRHGYILSPCLFNWDAEYIMWNAGLDERKLVSRLPGEIPITSDIQVTPPLSQKAEELKSLLMKVKEESKKAGLELNIQKTKIMASGPITSWQIDGETVETVSDFILGGSKITADGDCNHEN